MPRTVNTAEEYEFVQHHDTALSPEDLDKVRNWLQPTDYLADSGEFRRHLSSIAPGTGLWVCETDEYRNWHDSPDHGSLWIKGVAGAGKSVIAASIIQHLRTTENCPVLFFFFRNIVAANFSPRALMQDWLAQLLPHSPKLQFALQSRLDTSLAETSDNDLIQLFLDGVLCVPKVYCVGDALDEMSVDNRLFLDKLNSLATFRPQALKLLLTSRPQQFLQSALRDSSIVHFSLQQQRVDVDIASYLNHRFDQALKSEAHRNAKKHVLDMVASRSEGLFLYAKLTMDQVEAALLSDNHLDIAKLEITLPVGLEQTYDKILARQRQKHLLTIDIQVLVLEAVTHASRPLRLNELASLVQCIRPDIQSPKGFKTLVAISCGPLVEVLEDETLQVIHHSFTEFLRGDTRNPPTTDPMNDFPIISSGQAHKHMALNCLKYLQSSAHLESNQHDEDTPPQTVQGQAHPTRNDYKNACLNHPFLKYAVAGWPYHSRQYDRRDEDLFAAILEFLSPQNVSCLRWVDWGRGVFCPKDLPSTLYIAAKFGLSELVRELIRQGADVSARSKTGATPLHGAAVDGHAKVAAILIQHGCDITATAKGRQAIHFAAHNHRADVVKLLLEAGADLDGSVPREHWPRFRGGSARDRLRMRQPDWRWLSPIEVAARTGDTETLLVMIPFCKPEALERALCICCWSGHTDTVLSLLNNSDVSPNAMLYGGTALQLACDKANVECVRALIDRGADILKGSRWAPSRYGYVSSERPEPLIMLPLYRLVQSWTEENDAKCREILQILLDAGADIDQPDEVNNSPLLLAAGSWPCGNENVSMHISESCGHEDPKVRPPAIAGLVKAGADVHKKNRNGDSILHMVLRKNCDLATTRLLIEHGCDPNQIGWRGDTPLLCCLYFSPKSLSNQEKEEIQSVMQYLIEHGADPSCRDQDGTPFISKVMCLGTGLVKYLLRHGADPKVSGGKAPHLVVLAMLSDPELFETLLPICADDLIKEECWSKLSSVGHIDGFTRYVELLLSAGVDIETKTRAGCSCSKCGAAPLYLQCLHSEDKVRVLVAHGANPRAVDTNGNNALHILARSGRSSIEAFKSYIAYGVDPLSTNNKGQTLLHHVTRWYDGKPGFVELVHWLITTGVSVNAVDEQGRTPLHESLVKTTRGDHASRPRDSNHVNFLHALKQTSLVNFDIRDNDGLAVVHYAAAFSGEKLDILKTAGASVDLLTSDLRNVLHISSQSLQGNIVGYILDNSETVDIDQKDHLGRTPLHYTCAFGDSESVRLLLKHGADVNVVDSCGNTPLHACVIFKADAQANHEEKKHVDFLQPSGTCSHRCIKMLLDAGANVDALNHENQTALELALETGCTELIEIFLHDNHLFEEATKHFKVRKETVIRAPNLRDSMSTLMTRAQLPSPLAISENDNAACIEALKSAAKDPSKFLKSSTSEDVVRLINRGFKNHSLSSHVYIHMLLDEVLQPRYMHIAQGLSNVILHYSDSTSVQQLVSKPDTPGECRVQSLALTPLQLACKRLTPNMQTVEFLVEGLRVDLEARFAADENYKKYWRSDHALTPGGTVLHQVASVRKRWHLEALEYLLSKGVDVDAVDDNGQTALHIAARGHWLEMESKDTNGFWTVDAVRILMNYGADPSILDNYGLSPLHKACSAPDIMRELLQRGADPGAGLNSPLFHTICENGLASAELLLDHGVGANIRGDLESDRGIPYDGGKINGTCPLLYATMKTDGRLIDRLPFIHLFIQRGADLYLPVKSGETLIHRIFKTSDNIFLDTFTQEPLVSRVDFDRRDQHGLTVLMAACAWQGKQEPYRWNDKWSQKGTAPVLRILDRGADATLTDKYGKTALHYILENLSMPDRILMEFIERLEVAAILFLRDDSRLSPLHYALRRPRPEVCQLMVAKGASLLEPDNDGNTALHRIAATCLTVPSPRRVDRRETGAADYFDSCLDLWKLYLAHGGSINVTNEDGNTPLHTYLLSSNSNCGSHDNVCHLEFFDALFPAENGVDLFALNNEGETMLHIIARHENTSYKKKDHDRTLFKAFVDKGLDPLKEDSRGRSALDVASARGKDDIVGLFRRA